MRRAPVDASLRMTIAPRREPVRPASRIAPLATATDALAEATDLATGTILADASGQLPRGSEPMSAAPLTPNQAAALKWLREHTGDGCFDRNGVLLAAGETAPFMRSTWNALRDAGKVEIYKPAAKGRGRCRVLP